MMHKIGEFATVSSGSTPSRSRHKEFFENGTIPWVKTMDLTNGPVTNTDEVITELAATSCKTWPKDTVLVAMYGGFRQIGRTGILKIDAAVNQAIATISVDTEKCLPEYLIQYLNYRVFQWKRFAASSRKDPNITGSDVRNFPITLPHLHKQKAIAELLSTWDKAIEKAERLVLAKQSQLKQLSRKLLLGSVRLDKQKNRLIEGRFFKYPSDWSLVKVRDVSQEVCLRSGDSVETVLSCSKYDGFVNSLDYFGKQVFSSDTSNYKVIKKGQFGYPSNHIEEGSIGLLEHCEVGIVSPIYVVFEVNGDRVHAPYLFKLLKTNVYRHIFQVSTSSSVDRRGSLRWSDFSRLKVPLPSMAEQKKIAEALYVAEEEIKLLKQLAEKYRVQKRGLMQKLLTGEWRVNTDEEAA